MLQPRPCDVRGKRQRLSPHEAIIEQSRELADQYSTSPNHLISANQQFTELPEKISCCCELDTRHFGSEALVVLVLPMLFVIQEYVGFMVCKENISVSHIISTHNGVNIIILFYLVLVFTDHFLNYKIKV